MSSDMGRCPYTNMHEICKFSQELSPDEPLPRFKQCTIVSEQSCTIWQDLEKHQ